jgi:hypothetical protein
MGLHRKSPESQSRSSRIDRLLLVISAGSIFIAQSSSGIGHSGHRWEIPVTFSGDIHLSQRDWLLTPRKRICLSAGFSLPWMNEGVIALNMSLARTKHRHGNSFCRVRLDCMNDPILQAGPTVLKAARGTCPQFHTQRAIRNCLSLAAGRSAQLQESAGSPSKPF